MVVLSASAHSTLKVASKEATYMLMLLYKSLAMKDLETYSSLLHQLPTYIISSVVSIICENSLSLWNLYVHSHVTEVHH
jgi:hypothetical protein